MLDKKNTIFLLLRGQTNNFGTKVYDYVNKIFIAGLASNSRLYMSIYQSSEIIVQILFSIFGGILADFSNRKRILIITDSVSAILTFIAFLSFDSPKNVIILIIVNICLAFLYSFNGPSYKAIVRDLLSKKAIYKCNSYSRGLAESMNVVIPLLGVWIVNAFGFKIAMLINSFSFAASAFLEYQFVIINMNNSHVSNKKMGEGFWYIITNKELLFVLILASVFNFFDSGIVLYMPYLNNFLHNSMAYGAVLICQAIGSILGAYINKYLKADYSIKQYCNFLIIAATFLVLSSIIGVPIIMIISFGASSIFLMIFDVQVISKIQSEVTEEVLGRVFSIVSLLALLLRPIGSFSFLLININSSAVFGIISLFQIIACVIVKIIWQFYENKKSKINQRM